MELLREQQRLEEREASGESDDEDLELAGLTLEDLEEIDGNLGAGEADDDVIEEGND